MKLYEQKASGYTEKVGEGFNFWALIFGFFWFLYKGMFVRAILLLFGLFFLDLIYDNLDILILAWIITGSIANRSYEDYLIKKGYSVVKTKKSNNKKNKKIKKPKNTNNSELIWECDFCDKKFESRKEAVEHEKKCELLGI